MADRKSKQLVARAAVTAIIGMRRIWLPTGGNSNGVEVGAILTEVFFTANPYVTTGYIGERLGGAYSVDTIRRRLEQMVDDQLVESIEVGGRKLYRACPSAADATIRLLRDGVDTCRPLFTDD